MKRDRRIPLLVTGALLTAVAIACGSAGEEDATSATGDGGPTGPGSSSGAFGDGGVTPPAKGVLLIHAAAFPSMRLCFENYPEIPPQPDRKVLPEANVVGLDMGGVTRLGPMLKAPGKVYVISQKQVPARPGDTEDPTCGQFLATHDAIIDYSMAGSIDRPVGVTSAEVVAITGCGPAIYLAPLKIPQADCPGYDEQATSAGTFASVVFPISTTNTTTTQSMPVALVQMAPKLQQLTPEGQVLDVSFGALDAGAGAPLGTPVPSTAPLYVENASVTLSVDQTNEATFGTHGFRIAYRYSDGGAPAADAGGFELDQSLAQVQASSRPSSNPTTYFATASNVALFLLGDPRMRPTFDDGGTNDDFDPRRAVHLLAVPVRDDSEATPLGDAGATESDAGADAGDAGTR